MSKLQGLDYGRPRFKLPFTLIFLLACVFEFVVRCSAFTLFNRVLLLAMHDMAA